MMRWCGFGWVWLGFGWFGWLVVCCDGVFLGGVHGPPDRLLSTDRPTNQTLPTTQHADRRGAGMEGAGPGMPWWKTVLLDPRCSLLLRKQVNE